MGSLKRKSRGSDSMEDDVRLERRLLRKWRVNSKKNGISGSSSAKTPTRTKGNLPTQDHFPPDKDYMIFLAHLGLDLPTAAGSDRGFGANSASDSEAATRDVGSGLKGDWSTDIDMDTDLFKFLAEKSGGGGSRSTRVENDGVGNNGDAGATSGCDVSMDGGDGAAPCVDDSFLRGCCSSDRNGWSSKDDSGAETSDDGYDVKLVDSFHVDPEFVEEAGDSEGSENNGDDDDAVDWGFDSAVVAEEVTDRCNNVQSDPSGRDQTADDDIFDATDHDQTANDDIFEASDHYQSVDVDIFEASDHNHTADDDIFDASDHDQAADNDTVEASDATYGIFLQNMRVDGNSYRVELPVGNGKSLNVVYEKQDVSRGQFDDGETRQTSLQRKNREPEIRLRQGCNETQGHGQRIDERDTGCDSGVPNESNKSSLMGRKFSYKTEKGICSGFRREDSSQMEDLLEREREKKRKERHDSKVASGRERKSCLPMKTRTRDETGDAPETAFRTEAPMPARVQPKTGHTETKKVPATSLLRERKTDTRPCPSEKIMKAQKDVGDMHDRKRRRLISEETQRKESLNPISCEEPATTKTPSNNNQHCRPKIERVENDRCYEKFLSSLETKSKHVEYAPSVGEKVVYHDYPSSSPSTDSDVMEIDAATFANDANTPFVPAKNHEVIDLDLEPEEGHGGNYYNSEFRVKLLELLRKPYDQKEYKELLKEVSGRKPLEKNREFRHGRTMTVKMEGVGRSYLDNHKDFARKLHELKPDSECHRPVRLNLLRGFVYWLANIPLPGSFKPWLDESCLKVLPSCKRVPWS